MQRFLVAVVAVLAWLAVAQPAAAAPDFQLTVDPASQLLPPGGSVSFLVRVDALEGFAAPVTLSVGPLPAGVTAQFSRNPVTPSGSSSLTLIAAANAQLGSFDIAVTGTGGGVSHTTTRSLTVNFGLVPLCYGGAEGVVLDAETGGPLEGVRVTTASHSATTGADGRFSFTKMSLGTNNAPLAYTFFGSKTEYWGRFDTETVVCDQVAQVEIRLLRVRYGTVSGRITEGTWDPVSRKVITNGVAIGGARVSISGHLDGTLTSAADGAYQSGRIQLRDGNLPHENAHVSVIADGYWSNSNVTTVRADENSVADVSLVKHCTGTISGVVRFSATGLPAADKLISAWNGINFYTVNSDAEGRFHFPAAVLGHNNLQTTYQVWADHPNHFRASDSAPLPTCGSHDDTVLVLSPVPVKVPNYGFVEGYVHDEETGEPVANACVPASVCWGRTDANGYYKTSQLTISTDSSRTTANYSLNAGATGYWFSGSSTVTVVANETVRQDFVILRQRFGRVTGVVRDSATKLPIAGAAVGLGGAKLTGADGAYLSGNLNLNYRNAPVTTNFWTTATGYWAKHTGGVPVVADQVTEQDVEMIKICDRARIVGTVVDAETQLPIQNANVIGGSAASKTDAAGRYTLANLQVGTNNSPTQVSVHASAPGYFPQTKTVTIFCGATIVLDFGRPAAVFGTLEGQVTNSATGLPMGGVFVGTEWGASATTAADGTYRIASVPLEFDGSPRDWRVTADPADFDAKAKTATFRAGEVTRVDFTFGALKRTLMLRAEGLPPGTAWEPLVNVTAPAAAGEHAYVLELDDGSPASFSAPAEIDGGPGVRYVLERWRSESAGTVVSPIVVAADETLVAVYGLRRAPVADSGTVVTDEDTSTPVELVATDADGDVLTYKIVSGPGHGVLSGTPPSLTYTPAADYHGPDAIIFRASDGSFDSNDGTVSIEVRPVNDPPTARDDDAVTDEDTPLRLGAPELLVNDSDPDGDPLQVCGVDGGPEAYGTVTLAGGEVVYVPDADYHGPARFAYTACDGAGAEDRATVTLVVRPVNDAPSCEDLSFTLAEDGHLAERLRCTDVDGDELRFEPAGVPSRWTLDLRPDGTFDYRPIADANGDDAFGYAADDGNGGRGEALVRITVLPVNDGPTAEDAAVELLEDAPPVAIDLAPHVADVETADGDLHYRIVDGPAKGSLSGSGPVFAYDSDDDANGADSFTYQVIDRGDPDGCGTPGPGCDAPRASDVHRVAITIVPVNDPPTVDLDPPAAIDEGSSTTLRAAGADVDGDPLTYTWHAETGVVSGSGPSVEYGNDDGPRTDAVQVTVSDGELRASDTERIEVRNVPPRVDAGPDRSQYWGLAVVFAGAVTDPSAADRAAGFSPVWDFGDGSPPAAGLTASHAYGDPGSYTATLGVRDKDGAFASDTAAAAIRKRETGLALTTTSAAFGFGALSALLSDAVDAASARLAGRTVRFEAAGNAWDAAAGADGAAGVADLMLPPGTHAVRASFADDAHYLASSAVGAVTVVSTPGKVTAGTLRWGSFGRGGFNVQSDGTIVKGELQFHDETQSFHAHELRALGVSPDRRRAWFAGVGVDGRPFTAYVEDNGEPGRDDVFRIWVGGASLNGDGRLSGGNVQIHK